MAITDRAKDLIKSGGEWISSVDLENALMDHPDIVEAAVIAVPDERWEERPLALVVLTAGTAPDFPSYRDFLRKRVASWQVPEHWSAASILPRTTVGKIDKKALRAQHALGELDVTTLL
jgi:fatty-acyl-CoA synthase